MRRSMFRIVLLVSLGVAVGCVPAASAPASALGARAKVRTDQVVRSTGQRLHASARHTRRVSRPAPHRAERVSLSQRRVVRQRTRPVVVAGGKPAEAVFYYDNTLVGRDPDANVRLMLLRDNARTMWAR